MKPRVTDKTSPLFDDFDYSKTCSTKKKYTTEYHAQFAIDECKSRDPRLKLRSYKCPYCRNFHLTEI